jgi:hypothetical protein
MRPLAALLGFATSVALAQTAAQSVEPSSACPSFKDLGLKLDRRIASLKPGTTLQEFTRDFASRALEGERPQSPKGALFFVGIAEGNASLSDELQCRFDAGNRLVSCHRECCRSESREVTLEQYNALAVGESRSDVERRLCSPSLVERKSPTSVTTYYHIALPVGEHDEGQGVLLVFDQDRLSWKGMSPYY